MKRKSLALSLIVAVLVVFSSCGKYEDGPSVSLLSKKARITGVWQIEKMFENGTEVPFEEGMDDLKLELVKDGTGTMSASFGGMAFNIELEWEFSDDKTKLRMRMQGLTDNTWDEWDEQTILRLTNKECWLLDEEIEDGVTSTIQINLLKE